MMNLDRRQIDRHEATSRQVKQASKATRESCPVPSLLPSVQPSPMVGLPLPGPARTCPHQPPLPERNSSSSSCCRFPLSTSHCPFPAPSPPARRDGCCSAWRDTYEYMKLQTHIRVPQPVRVPDFLRQRYVPSTRKAAEFSRRAGSWALLPLPALPSFPWNLDRALDLALGPATGAGRDPQRADLGHSHPRIKKLLPPFLESSCSPESRPSGLSPLQSSLACLACLPVPLNSPSRSQSVA